MADQRKTPKLEEIARAWLYQADAVTHETFPRLAGYAGDWGAPFCFRCGLLTPTRTAVDYPAGWSDARRFDHTWAAARGWLERAHLHDRNEGGSNDELNLVPLCPLCHEEQRVCSSREQGIEYVNGFQGSRLMVSLSAAVLFERYFGRRPGSKGQALRWILRARAVVGEGMARVIEEGEADRDG